MEGFAVVEFNIRLLFADEKDAGEIEKLYFFKS